MAGASAARTSPPPPQRRAPLIGCPPTPSPARPAPSASPSPTRAAGPFLPHTPPPLPPRGRRTEPALPPSRGSGPGTAGALRKGLGRTQRAARVSVSRTPAGTVAAAAGLGARRARRLHLRGQIGVRRVAGTPEARGRGDGCSLGRVSAGSNPGKGKQRHGTSAHWMRIHLPLELGIDFVKDIM
ncbi:formin-like protein 5 [Trachypithecus francoisi]|uniref:formin-like protein 5 n=1 Tax=Trachypithecus francoisi TaxID=54180 RepID=UPI00141BE7FB|nr:formin-like protein 5 [Trachypithecus francoisi]